MTNSRLLTIAAGISLIIIAVAVCVSLIMRSHVTSHATAPNTVAVNSPSPSSIEHQFTIDAFLTVLKAKNLLPYKQEQRGEGCGLVGATDCIDLNYYYGDVEVYQFDTSITTGKDALEALKKNGDMGVKCYFNKNLAISRAHTIPKWEQIKSVFSSM